ncbi:MAG: hypothetical protein FWF69_02450 [Firmicutes bacterium]|nr:hypothetical protein [Bacillota bacterium]
MNCINFDTRFEQYATEWMRKHAAEYKNSISRMEAKIPEVYLQWLNTPMDWLEGQTPGMYFTQYHDAGMLMDWMLAYHAQKVPVPDQLWERIVELGPAAEKALTELLDDAKAPEEARLGAISMLTEMESRAPMEKYVAWIAARDERDDLADMAAEALTAMGRAVVRPILDAAPGATPAGRETFVDVLCNFPGDPAVYDLALDLFHANPQKRALCASLLGKLGDARAIPTLRSAMEDPSLSYLDYIELRNAVEALGGDAPVEREFAGDPYYESLRRME